jgi:hypothetical protein
VSRTAGRDGSTQRPETQTRAPLQSTSLPQGPLEARFAAPQPAIAAIALAIAARAEDWFAPAQRAIAAIGLAIAARAARGPTVDTFTTKNLPARPCHDSYALARSFENRSASFSK